MNIIKTLAICLSFFSACNLNAFRITEFDHPQWRGTRYRSYCFSKSESDQIRACIDQGKNLSTAIAVIPGAGDAAKAIAAALGIASFTTWWASAKGQKGFSVNIPIKGVGLPYLWESD